MAQRKKKPEQAVEETEVSEAVPEKASSEAPREKSQAVLEHRAKLKRMDEIRGF